eukprot:3412911-Pleurochrysis_carterae.AAC.6
MSKPNEGLKATQGRSAVSCSCTNARLRIMLRIAFELRRVVTQHVPGETTASSQTSRAKMRNSSSELSRAFQILICKKKKRRERERERDGVEGGRKRSKGKRGGGSMVKLEGGGGESEERGEERMGCEEEGAGEKG